MIFHALRAIHFHPGKTAGTSIEKMLLPGDRDAMVADRHIMFGYDREYGIYLQHASCKTMLEIIGDEIFSQYYKFSVVRNPYTRLLSVYYYGIKQHSKEFGSFKKFVAALPSVAATARNVRGAHVTPQIHHTHIDGQSVCQAIAKFENLEADLERIKSELGVQVALPRLNVQRHPRLASGGKTGCYDKEMIAIMQDVYAEDFEAYGYDAEPPANMRRRFLQPGRWVSAARGYLSS